MPLRDPNTGVTAVGHAGPSLGVDEGDRPPPHPEPAMTQPSTSRTRRVATAAALVTAGAIGATAITGLAFASNGAAGSIHPTSVSAATGATGGAGAMNGAGRRAGMLRDVLHGELTVKDGDGTKVVDLQRGKLTAASATSITVASTDGFTATYAVTSATVVHKARQTVAASSLAVGDQVLVRATGGTATVVRTR